MSADPADTLPLDLPAEQTLPRGPAAVRKRALAAGFAVRVTFGRGHVERTVKVPIIREDGTPELTPTGRPRSTLTKLPTLVDSIGMHLQHDQGGQGQAGWWVDGDFEQGWGWPADGSDIRRTITANQLGTLVDLEQLARNALVAARTGLAEKESSCRCWDHLTTGGN